MLRGTFNAEVLIHYMIVELYLLLDVFTGNIYFARYYLFTINK